MKRTPLKQVKPLLVVKLEKAHAKYASLRDSVPSSSSSVSVASTSGAPAETPDVKPSPAEEQKPQVAPLSPTKKVEWEKKLRASQHNYHKFLKMATTTLSEREIGMCPAEVISEIKARKQKVRNLSVKTLGLEMWNRPNLLYKIYETVIPINSLPTVLDSRQ